MHLGYSNTTFYSPQDLTWDNEITRTKAFVNLYKLYQVLLTEKSIQQNIAKHILLVGDFQERRMQSV